jgi:hypothetical protein
MALRSGKASIVIAKRVANKRSKWMHFEPNTQSAGAILGLVATALISASTTGHAEIFEGFPDAIVCRLAHIQAVHYIAFLKDDGSAIYMTLANRNATVTPDHVFHRPGAQDCDGKTLEQLKQSGQTRVLK